MKKIFITIVSFVCLLCCAIALTACGHRNNLPETPAHTHNYLWVDNGDGTHKQHCAVSGCDESDINVGNHDFASGNCVCGKAKPLEHTHSFAEWVSDGEITHTHICSCGESETENHIWSGETITTPPSCKNVGKKTYSCTACKDTKTEQIEKLTEHTFTREQAEEYYLKTRASCTSRAVYYKSCFVCYAKGTDTFEYGDFTGHPYTAWTDDGDDNHKRSCSCGASETEPHDFSGGNCVCGKAKPIIATVGLEFELNVYDKESYAVKGIGTATDTEIVVPSEYNGKPVTQIANYAFQNNESIVSVKIPDSVLYIGNAAFKDCLLLNSITIGNGLKAIDPEAFMNCPIETASIPAVACMHIEKSVLKTVAITSGTAIADSALKDCTELSGITICDTVTSIGGKAFQNCRALVNIDIPDSVETIGSYAFSGCNSLAGITAGANNPNYACQDGILYNKAKTEFVHVPKAITGRVTVANGIVSIEYDQFKHCNSLTEIILPSGVTAIGFGAFYNCAALISVTIPDTVTAIGEDAFADCSALVLIRFSGTKEQWNAVEKGYNWDFNTGNYIVRCNDGDAAKTSVIDLINSDLLAGTKDAGMERYRFGQ